MKFHSHHTSNVEPVEQIPGGFRRVLADGEHMMLIEWRMNAGVVIPMHAHPHEQCGYVISGEMIFTIDEVERAVPAGTGYAIPGNVPHSARFAQPTLLIDVFSPPREDYRVMSAAAPSYMLGTMQQASLAPKPKAKKAAPAKKKPAAAKKKPLAARKKPATTRR